MVAQKVPVINRYRNITVSGGVGTGKTTLAKLLNTSLGWQYRNTGELYRRFVQQSGIKLENTTHSSDDIHRALDLYVTEHLRTDDHHIFEGWLAGFMARGMKDVLKVLVLCSDDAIRIKRVANREDITVKEAEEHLRTREAENLSKWKKLYGRADFWKPEEYDLVIDTRISSEEVALQQVLDKLGKVE